MGAFRNDLGTYEIDYSEEVAETLKKLWETDKEKYENLEEYIYGKFDWLSGLQTDIPTLFNGFKSEKEAKKQSVVLSRAINKWLKEN